MCVCVCVLLCKKEDLKSCEWIFMKLAVIDHHQNLSHKINFKGIG